jgi:thiosulfate/3-mercaptopyruvate sulfurtransferase
MPYTTLISTADLADHLADPNWAIADCRFSLTDTTLGERSYGAGHIPGAVYAHLDRDLSGPVIPGKTGRHPLPAVIAFAETLSCWGIAPDVQVVVYDDAGGVFAGRLWWMLRWLGHNAVAVLDGDLRAWQREGRPLRHDEETRIRRTFVVNLQPQMQVTLSDMQENFHNPQVRLVDARTAERFRGENETIDARGGHIPGAVCAYYGGNLDAEGYFRPQAELRQRFGELLGVVAPNQAIFYCGSGVSACHNLLAMEHAGLSGGRLYVGSWSEWSADPTRPTATTEG